MPRELRSFSQKKRASAPPLPNTAAPPRIPLNLKSVIAPYRDRGRFTIRLEQLPQSARLSAGTNNGDRTWSLALDELEDLAYFPPPGAGAHTLGVRLIAKDEDGAHTLALIDLGVDADAEDLDKRDGGAVIALAQDKALQAEVAQLRASLAERDAALAKRDAELAERGAAIARGEDNRAEVAQLRAALAARDAQLAERDAELAERDIELAHRNARLDAREKELLEQQQLNSWTAGLAEEKREAELTQAERDWQDAEASRREALKVELEEAFDKRLAEQDRRSGAVLDALNHQHEEALSELRAQLSAAEAAIAGQGAEKAAWHGEVAKLQQEFEDRMRAMRSEAETEAARREREFVETLGAARKTAEAEAGERLKAAETGWQKRLAELAARCEVAEARIMPQTAAREADHAAELNRLRAQLECVEQDAQWALKEARAAAEREMVATLKAAEAEWQNQIAQAETDASVLADLRAQLEHARQEGEEAVAAARAEAGQDVAAKLKAAEAEWKSRGDAVIAELTQRLGEAEAALADANKQNAADADAYIRELNAELRNLRKSLVAREAELARLKAVLEEERAGTARGAAPVAAWKPVAGHQSVREPAPQKTDRRLIRDAAMVAVAVMAAVLAWPSVAPWFLDAPAPTQVAAVARPKPVPVGDILSIATVERGVNLRGGPSVKDKVLGSAARGDNVTILEERGNWVRGVVSGQGRPGVEGWIYKSALGAGRTGRGPQGP